MVLSICRICLPVFLGLALLVGAAVPAQADLLPHRVVYTLALGTSGTLTGGNGLMTFEIKDVCDGWAMDLKAELSLAGEDGQIHRLGWSQVSWESKDGKPSAKAIADLKGVRSFPAAEGRRAATARMVLPRSWPTCPNKRNSPCRPRPCSRCSIPRP